jgi:P-loop Domain of unknown function (DUF2791)
VLEDLILHFVSKTSGFTTKTQLVKFLYLSDLYSVKWTGKQLTRLDWYYYHYSPWDEEIDSALKRLFWIFTGTPEFFDANRGVAGLEPLHNRLKLIKNGKFYNQRQPQLVLKPFDAEGLTELALKLRELYPTDNRSQLNRKVTLEFIERLVAEITKGFGGDVGIVPREFLRQLVTILDLASTEPEFDPMTDSGYKLEPNSEEIRIIQGRSYFNSEPEDHDKYAVTF